MDGKNNRDIKKLIREAVRDGILKRPVHHEEGGETGSRKGVREMGQSKLKGTVESVAEKYAALVEKRIDSAKELTGTDLHDIYESIQMLGHIVATLERFSRMETLEPYPRTAD